MDNNTVQGAPVGMAYVCLCMRMAWLGYCCTYVCIIRIVSYFFFFLLDCCLSLGVVAFAKNFIYMSVTGFCKRKKTIDFGLRRPPPHPYPRYEKV